MFSFPTDLTNEEWSEIAGQMAAHGWDDFTLARQGDLTGWLTVKHPQRYQTVWNNLVKEIRPQVDGWIDLNLASVLDDVARSYVRWDLLHAALETRYVDLKNAPLFYSEHVVPAWQAGRIPYGWQGEYPDGDLLSQDLKRSQA